MRCPQLLPVPLPEAFLSEDIPVLTASALLPHAEGAARFNRYYQTCAKVFTSYCRCHLLPQAADCCREALRQGQDLPQWHASLKASFTLQTPQLVSIRTDLTLTGAPQPLSVCHATTWDLRQGLPLSLPDFFPQHANLHALLRAAAKAQGVPHWHTGRRDFYLTPDALVCFRQTAAGVRTIRLPYQEEIGPFLPAQAG